MAVTTDVLRGVLDVPGQPYDLLLLRSVDFDPFYGILRGTFVEGTQIVLALDVGQQLWDRADPGSFTRHIENDPLPGTPSHRVLLTVAIGDHQVTPLGAHIMARAIGARSLAPAVRPIWGVPETMATDAAPYEGSAIVEYELGLPPEPLGPEPLRAGEDPHGRPRHLRSWGDMVDRFFRTGEAVQMCAGPCDPE
jgi:hypothetical protein